MSSITVEFQFEIGDFVYMKSAPHTMESVPNAFVVYERIAQQCHGGVQKHYKLGGRDNMIPETLLTRDRPPYQPRCQAYQDEREELLLSELRAQDKWLCIRKQAAEGNI